MDPILLTIIVGAALIVAIVWIAITVISMVVRTLFWFVKQPVRMGGAMLRVSSPRTPKPRLCSDRRCTATLPDEARFCGRCGTAAEVATSESVVKNGSDRRRCGVASLATRPAFSRFA